ncbi:uncharacterized protein LOC135845225 [Planococcus citri]|uniref:uncharacterized protein LOC135845225 n=1 Tax=Planococcus citri TaxID=170843 RepID=UPI0031F751F6
MAGVKKSRLEVLIGIIILCEIVLPTTAIAPCSLEPSEDNCKIVGVKCNRELKVCECWDNRIFTATGTCSNNTSAKNRTVACKFYKDCRDACMESPCGSETETVSENSSKAPEKVYVNRGGLGFSEWVIIAVIAAIVTCATITSLIVSYRFYFSRIVDCRRFVEGSEDMEMNNQNPEAVVSPPGDILTREDMGTVRDAVIAANVTTTISFLRASEIEDMSSSIITNIHKVSEGKFSNVHIGELQLHSETDETTNELQLHSETDETTKTRVLALKEIKCDYDSESVKCTLREVECMRMVNHVNLIRLTGFFNRGVSKLPWIVFDYVKYGSLKDVLLDSNTRFPQLKREEPHVITEVRDDLVDNEHVQLSTN